MARVGSPAGAVRCYVCGKRFTDGELVFPIMRYVTNEKRGDFVPLQGEQFAHARHLKEGGQ